MEQKIQNVAIYLRKSREDETEADTLLKHRNQLLDFVKSKGWHYTIFEEIGSSDTIEYRKEFSRLLEEVKTGIHEAVVCMDLDRLSRGDAYDYGFIKRIFSDTKTLIITPYETIDMSDETNIMNDMKATLGRYEYLQTKKRLREGKIRSARLGRWANGKAPIGYDYDRDTKKLVINEEQAAIVKLIYGKYLEGTAMFQIGHELNRRGYITKQGSYFQDATISRILTNQIYIGNMVFGKSEGSGHLHKKTKPVKKKDEEEWIVVENAHPAIVSKEDFLTVQQLMAKRTKVPTRARQGAFALSGLLYCADCGRAMRFTENGKGKTYVVKCQSADPFGNRCGNPGINMMDLLEIIKRKINIHYQELVLEPNKEEKKNIKTLKKSIETWVTQTTKLEAGIGRLKDLYISGYIDKPEFETGIQKQNNILDKAKFEIRQMELELSQISTDSQKGKILRLESIKEFSLDDDTTSINTDLKTIIKKVQYKREDIKLSIEVEFY